MEQISWKKLKNKLQYFLLIPGQFYRITDYISTTILENTLSGNHAFDIIVRANSSNSLDENALTILHDKDLYFKNSKLDMWNIKYDINNNSDKYSWADTKNGKGVIYYMRDEFGNEAFYDFKNIIYNNEYYTFGKNIDYSMKGKAFKNVIKEYYQDKYSRLTLNFVYFNLSSEDECYNNILKKLCYRNVFNGTCYNNTISEENAYNDFGKYFINNKFGKNCCANKIGNYFNNNIFESFCSVNYFGDYCNNNILKIDCINNKFLGFNTGNQLNVNCLNNTYGEYCSYNKFSMSCNNNSFDLNCSYNMLGEYCCNNVLGKHCNKNTIRGFCINNKLGNYCSENKIIKMFICGFLILEKESNKIITSSKTSSIISPIYDNSVEIIDEQNLIGTIYKSPLGYIIKRKTTKEDIGDIIDLGNSDSIDNYIEEKVQDDVLSSYYKHFGVDYYKKEGLKKIIKEEE